MTREEKRQQPTTMVEARTHGEYACRTKSGDGGVKRGGSRKLPSAAAGGRTPPARCPACATTPGLVGGPPPLHNLAPLALVRQAMEEA